MADRVLVISIKPKWVSQILSGEKTLELRRRPPWLAQPVSALIYETGPTYRLRAKCLMGPIRSDTPDALWSLVSRCSRVSHEEYDAYFAGAVQAHAIEISRVREMEPELTLARLRRDAGFVVPQSWAWASTRLLEALEPFK
jgi:predicted transcriptional regulator